MNFCSLYSGSSGNSLFLESENAKILVDTGMSCKKIEEALKLIEVNPSSINAILVTHEHSDHIQGIPMMAKQFEVPIYATGGTLDQICEKDKKNVIKRENSYKVVNINNKF